MTVAIVISFLFFLFSLKLLISIFFSKVDSNEYEERLVRFLNKKQVIKAKKLNRI